MQTKTTRYAAVLAVALALFVVMLGAYTRLTDAGLGCPDWPGCYGHLVLPSAKPALTAAQQSYPDSPIESRKAWTEMGHRYAAGTLALVIVFLGCRAMVSRFKKNATPWVLPALLIGLVCFQAALGMWTVTMKLLPVVVMAHLLGGIIIFSCLSCLCLQSFNTASPALPQWRFAVGLGLIIVVIQVALGGWVSSNYAGIACIGFPQCNGQWLPALHFTQGFNLFSPVGANYQGGVLDNEVRVTIQTLHRLWALVTAAYVIGLSVMMLARVPYKTLRLLAIAALVLVAAQFTLGVLNVLYLLPLGVAVLHNGVAALLMATVFMMFYLTMRKQRDAG
ncbi:heme A synthase [Legionella taurinensis]|uniref:Cytochrome B n=1 Tax=Legionella taurinensis TaxID=70611 RepID=A0AB38N617_9GAMM|nr:COX15/CtaA family protein [Legionella taurinensis]MDX1837536.1 COX15/CtaA family protein [Legionella taurinensis]PUT40873.1 cytochrome B [Legionella taurinensis]PUT44294.1 cytochrome B [Legionella taurinensis]PUT47596.1 cytochrome B [Legionella taurinensis]PUT48735.1 cytochrome B [Legionella taurinensis]